MNKKTVGRVSLAAACTLALGARLGSAQVGDQVPLNPPSGGGSVSARAARAATFKSASPGANSAYALGNDIDTTLVADSSGPACGGNPQTLVSATISKGKAKSVLAIEAELSHAYGYEAAAWQVPTFLVSVNGLFDVVSTKYSKTELCSAADTRGLSCTLTGTWWVDLDAAEAAHPGAFKKQPLQVDLVGCIAVPAADVGKAATIGTASLTVRMEKK